MRSDLEPRRKYFTVVGNGKERISSDMECVLADYERIHKTVESILHEKQNFP